jgi:hypothetical protein
MHCWFAIIRPFGKQAGVKGFAWVLLVEQQQRLQLNAWKSSAMAS